MKLKVFGTLILVMSILGILYYYGYLDMLFGSEIEQTNTPQILKASGTYDLSKGYTLSFDFVDKVDRSADSIYQYRNVISVDDSTGLDGSRHPSVFVNSQDKTLNVCFTGGANWINAVYSNIEPGKWYSVKIIVTPTKMETYIDSKLVYSIDHTPETWVAGNGIKDLIFVTPNPNFISAHPHGGNITIKNFKWSINN